MKKKVTILLVITAVFLLWVLWDVDTHEAQQAIRGSNPFWIAMMFAGYLLSHLLRSLRLWILLNYAAPYMRVFSINTVGFLAINVMPMRLGEAVRPYLLMEREGVPFGQGLAAIFMERLLDMMMLLGMLFGMSFLIQLPEGGLIIAGISVVSAGQKAAGGLVVLGSTGILGLVFLGEYIFQLLSRFQLLHAPIEIGRKFRLALLDLFSKPLRAFLLLVLSVVVWLLTIFAVMMALWAFEDLPHGFDAAWSCWTITLAGMTAIPTPGFFGVYELCCSAALSLWGVSTSLSKTFALCLHFGQLIFISVLGSIFMLKEGLSLHVFHRSKEGLEKQS